MSAVTVRRVERLVFCCLLFYCDMINHMINQFFQSEDRNRTNDSNRENLIQRITKLVKKRGLTIKRSQENSAATGITGIGRNRYLWGRCQIFKEDKVGRGALGLRLRNNCREGDRGRWVGWCCRAATGNLKTSCWVPAKHLGSRPLDLHGTFQRARATGSPTGPAGFYTAETRRHWNQEEKPLSPAEFLQHLLLIKLITITGSEGEMSAQPSSSVTEQDEEKRIWSSKVIN